MARRPLTFGVRLRDRDRGESLNIRACEDGAGGYTVEREGRGVPGQQRRHATLAEAVRDGARSWRSRLN